MKKISTYLFALLISNIYAQCDDYNQSQCSNDNNCEWIENIEIEYCDGDSAGECLTEDECSWDLTYGGYLSFEWYYSCNGYYEIDNGYCQETEISECLEMNESECSYENICEWIENIELVSCNDISSQQECNAVGCSWYNGNYYACSICCWGEYEVDNSYCEETEYQLGDLNQDIVINIQDVIIVINLILNGEFDLAADVNSDNTINVLDIIELVNIILS